MGFWDRIIGEDPEDVRKEQASVRNRGVAEIQPRGVNQGAFNNPFVAQQRERFQAGAAQAGSRGAPVLGPEQAQFRGGQADLVSALQAAAAGRGPSAAQAQLRMGLGQALAAASAQAASARGTNPALAQRLALQQQAAISQNVAAQAAALRAQEQQSAQMQLGQALQAARGQDIAAGQTNVEAQLRQQALNDQLVQFYQQKGFDAEQAQFLAYMHSEQLRAEQDRARMMATASLYGANIGSMPGPSQGLLPQLLGGAAQGLGAYFGMKAAG